MLCSRGAFIKLLPVIKWKVENVPHELDYPTKKISGQRAESAGFSQLFITKQERRD